VAAAAERPAGAAAVLLLDAAAAAAALDVAAVLLLDVAAPAGALGRGAGRGGGGGAGRGAGRGGGANSDGAPGGSKRARREAPPQVSGGVMFESVAFARVRQASCFAKGGRPWRTRRARTRLYLPADAATAAPHLLPQAAGGAASFHRNAKALTCSAPSPTPRHPPAPSRVVLQTPLPQTREAWVTVCRTFYDAVRGMSVAGAAAAIRRIAQRVREHPCEDLSAAEELIGEVDALFRQDFAVDLPGRAALEALVHRHLPECGADTMVALVMVVGECAKFGHHHYCRGDDGDSHFASGWRCCTSK
jgi:hypothetical protein